MVAESCAGFSAKKLRSSSSPDISSAPQLPDCERRENETLGRQAGAVELFGGEREDLAAGVSHADRVFVLRRQRAVACHRGPAVRQDFHMRPAEVDHRLDGEDHAGPHLDALIGAAIMQDVGRVVEQLADAVAAEVAHHRAALALGIALDGRANGAGAGAGPDRGNAAHQAFVGDFEQAFRRAFYGADRVHARGIAVPAVEDVGDVDVDDVAILQRLVVGDAMADDMIDRGAGRLGVAAVVESRRQRAMIHAELENETIYGVGGDAGRNHRHQFVEAARREVACLAHAGKTFLAIEADLAGVSERCRGGVEISDHWCPSCRCGSAREPA